MMAVVIPYFQRAPGILARALASIATQQHGPHNLKVLVVDDGSPAPAQAELAACQAASCRVSDIGIIWRASASGSIPERVWSG